MDPLPFARSLRYRRSDIEWVFTRGFSSTHTSCDFDTLLVSLFHPGRILCFEQINKDMNAHSSGVYIEMEFLAVICNVGQGFVSFAVFWFNKIFFSFLSFERFGCLQPWCFAKKVKTVPLARLDERVQVICQRFKAHYIDKWKVDLVCDLRFHFHKDVFHGDQLVDWIIEYGLASTRMDAVHYGNCLLQGQIIQHCVNEHHFYDLPYFYRFCLENPSSSQSSWINYWFNVLNCQESSRFSIGSSSLWYWSTAEGPVNKYTSSFLYTYRMDYKLKLWLHLWCLAYQESLWYHIRIKCRKYMKPLQNYIV